jgi:hypothetical protein
MNLSEQITELATAVVAAREVGADPVPVMRRAARRERLELTPAIERAVWLRARNLWEHSERDARRAAA